jgi:15-cis-phytoene synthase
MNPDEYCRQKAVASGSSLHYSLLFLPPERRRAVTALCAYCKEVREVVDSVSDAQVARAKLAWWRLEIGKLFGGNASHPVMHALRPFAAGYGLRAEHLNQVIDGMEMDLAQTRYLDFAGLSRYCDLTAGAAASAAAQILGCSNARTLDYAANLGTALELTRIIRNVGADARRNRIYLPMDELRQFEVPAADILQPKHSDGFVKLMAFQARRAESFYDKALGLLPAEDRRAQRPGLIMAAIYRTLLQEIERDGFHVLTQRIALTPIRKFWLAWKTYVRG